MELDKRQKFLLMLIVFLSIAFAYEFSAAAGSRINQPAAALEVEPIPIGHPVPTNSNSVQSPALDPLPLTESKQTDYGQSFPLPPEPVENETEEKEEKVPPPPPPKEEKENMTKNESAEFNQTDGKSSESESAPEQEQGPEQEPEPGPKPEPPAHDLGISKLYTKNDSKNPLRLEIKIQVKNFGTVPEDGLRLLRTIGNETKEYGPYEKEIKTTNMRTYSYTFPAPGEYNITFEILNYTGFGEDANASNNIKSMIIFL